LKIKIDSRTLPDDQGILAHNLAVITQRPVEQQVMHEGEYSLTFDIIGGDNADYMAICACGYQAIKV